MCAVQPASVQKPLPRLAHLPSPPISWHNNHEPLEVPQAQLDKFEFVYKNCSVMAGGLGKNNTCTAAYMASADAADRGCCFRQYYSAMTNYVDMHIGQVVDAIKAKGMWENTLFVVSSDNGGPIYRNGAAGANNFPCVCAPRRNSPPPLPPRAHRCRAPLAPATAGCAAARKPTVRSSA